MAATPHYIDAFQSIHAKAPPHEDDGKRWPSGFRTWIENNDTLDDTDKAAIVTRIASMARRPRISVLMPVHNPPVRYLLAAVNSVRCQLYPDWELCVADDCSTDPDVLALLQQLGSRDPRIRVTYRTQPGHIAHTSNDALAIASGEFVALLDHDDLLATQALYMVAEEINAHPHVAIIYSDEDKIDADNVRYGPYFKQHFNRDVFLAQNCINHLGVFRRSLMIQAGGFSPGTEGAQDYDITLRILEHTEDCHVRHIPHILYHWRAVPGSTALDPMAKTYAFEAGQRAIAGHLERCQQAATVQHGVQLGVYRVQRRMPALSASLIVTGFTTQLTAGRQDIAWLQAVLQGTRARLSEVLVATGAADSDVLRASRVAAGDGPPVTGIATDAAISWPAAANLLASEAAGDVLVFLAAGLHPTHPEALRELIVQAQRPAIGAVGGCLQRPDGTILHDGYVIGRGGLCGSFHANWPAHTSGYFGLNHMTRLCAAVGGHAFAIRRAVFASVQGFDKDFATAWADVDMCLRLRQRGLGVVYTPFAAFITPAHIQAPPQNNRDTVRLMHRHRAAARVDPYWNPNFINQPGIFELAPDTSALKPWRRGVQRAG